MMQGGWFGMSGGGLFWLFPVLIVVLVVVLGGGVFGKRAAGDR